MTDFRRFEDLHAWQKARELAQYIYDLTRPPAFSADYDLRRQLRRAAQSAMTNVAEGFGRRGDREFLRYLNISRGSAIEVQSLLYVALDSGQISENEFRQGYSRADAAISLVAALSNHLKRSLKQE